MKNLYITKIKSGIRIEGYPDAVKVIKIINLKSKRLSDLALHKEDLEFALDCLDNINFLPENPRVIRQGLWRCAVIHFIKCFGSSKSRFSLSEHKIFKGNSLALVNFNYFKELRRMHFVHDGNSYSQSIPGAIINNGKKTNKIEKIVCLNALAETLEQVNYSNLHFLVTVSKDFVIKEFDSLAKEISLDLEKESYECLYSYENIVWSFPSLEDIGKSRNK